jgi:septum formation protein
MPLVLASAPPRRAELLTAAGFQFRTLAVTVDERVRDGESPSRYVRRLAAEKSARGRQDVQDAIVLGADTAVVVDGEILGKPLDQADAERMLRCLAGRRHQVLTGVSLRFEEQEVGRVETTAVVFAPLSAAEIRWYVESGEGLDKAGGYAIQGLASRFVIGVEGSCSNVVGLPVACVYELLKEIGRNTRPGHLVGVV